MASDKTSTIRIKPQTKERLDKEKHKGQTYDGFINELLDKSEKGGK